MYDLLLINKCEQICFYIVHRVGVLFRKSAKALPIGGEQSRACFGRKRQGGVDEQYLLL